MTKVIGIDASRAFQKNRTGIEEYSYQILKHLVDKLSNHQVVLYIKKSQISNLKSQKFPNSWEIKVIRFPYLWTQLGLSLEMLLHPVDVLFIPAHTVPLIHPKNTIVTIHGLEYEFIPKAYSFWGRVYTRWSIKNSCQWARTIIAVSNNTKNDLIKLYGIKENKIRVIYEGYGADAKSQISNLKSQINTKYKIQNTKYLLFIGRLEERKNIIGIIKTFEILKEKYKIPHKLALAGKPGFGYKKVMSYLSNSSYASDIIQTGFVSEEEKWELLKNADVFLFPTFYEGFGLPIPEAQSVGVPVVAGDNSSIPEIVIPKVEPSEFLRFNLRKESSALLVNSNNTEEIAEAVHKLISDKNLRNDIIKKGLENVKRFSWEKCANQITTLLNG